MSDSNLLTWDETEETTCIFVTLDRHNHAAILSTFRFFCGNTRFIHKKDYSLQHNRDKKLSDTYTVYEKKNHLE